MKIRKSNFQFVVAAINVFFACLPNNEFYMINGFCALFSFLMGMGLSKVEQELENKDKENDKED